MIHSLCISIQKHIIQQQKKQMKLCAKFVKIDPLRAFNFFIILKKDPFSFKKNTSAYN